MMDLYGEKHLVILVPNICHLVFTVGFFSCHLVFTVGFFLISSPRRDNIVSQNGISALECGAKGSLSERRYIATANLIRT